MSIFNKRVLRCSANAGKSECAVVDELRGVQNSLEAKTNILKRIEDMEWALPHKKGFKTEAEQEIWGRCFTDMLAQSRSRFGYSLYWDEEGWRHLTVSKLIDIICKMPPKLQLQFVEIYDAIAPLVREMRNRDQIQIELKQEISDLKDQESKLKTQLGIQ